MISDTTVVILHLLRPEGITNFVSMSDHVLIFNQTCSFRYFLTMHSSHRDKVIPYIYVSIYTLLDVQHDEKKGEEGKGSRANSKRKVQDYT